MDSDNLDSLFEEAEKETVNRSRSIKAESRRKRKQEKETRNKTRSPKLITPRNEHQKLYMESIQTHSLVFGIGDAGVGKTFVASAVLSSMLMSGTIDKVCISRPTVTKTKHKNGFLPGTLEEKQAPWLIPVIDGIKTTTGAQLYAEFVKRGSIEFVPFEYMRGRTFSNCGVILDEAQNCDIEDMQLFLTRQGENTTTIVCGDANQADIPNSGLKKVVHMAKFYCIPDTFVVEFPEDSVVRSEQTKNWVKAFRLEKESANSEDNEVSFKDNLPAFLA